MQKINTSYKKGITLTCPCIYGPQGRHLRLAPRFKNLNSNATKFSFEQHRVTNFEMETAGIYAMGELLGHRCLSISVIMAHRIFNTFSKTPAQSIQKMIEEILEKVSHL